MPRELSTTIADVNPTPVLRPRHSDVALFSTLTRRSIAKQSANIDNEILLFRERQSAKLARRYTLAALAFVTPGASYVAYQALAEPIPLLGAAFIVFCFGLVLILLAGVLEQLLLDEVLERHLNARYDNTRCWEMMTRCGGIAHFNAGLLYTDHPLAAPTVAVYLEHRGFTEHDREVADVLIEDGTALDLGRLIDAAISLR